MAQEVSFLMLAFCWMKLGNVSQKSHLRVTDHKPENGAGLFWSPLKARLWARQA
jgi:hypothetical protein